MPTQVFKLVQINQNPTSITFKAQSSELYFSDMLMAYSLHPLTDQSLSIVANILENIGILVLFKAFK